MKFQWIAGAMALVMVSSSAEAAGCVSGAVVGGVAGHFAHRHALAGAAIGCVVGHELAVKKRREREERLAEQRRERELAHNR